MGKAALRAIEQLRDSELARLLAGGQPGTEITVQRSDDKDREALVRLLTRKPGDRPADEECHALAKMVGFALSSVALESRLTIDFLKPLTLFEGERGIRLAIRMSDGSTSSIEPSPMMILYPGDFSYLEDGGLELVAAGYRFRVYIESGMVLLHYIDIVKSEETKDESISEQPAKQKSRRPRWAEENRKTEVIRFRADPHLIDKVYKAAVENRQTVSDWLREAVTNHLEQPKPPKP